jgi:hypothetical protein
MASSEKKELRDILYHDTKYTARGGPYAPPNLKQPLVFTGKMAH